MRIACLHLPGFPIQVHARSATHLVGSPFAVSSSRDVPRILACSRAARAAGVREGMTVTQARKMVPALRILDADPPAYREAMEELGEALLEQDLSDTVDIETPGQVYAVVPPGKKSRSFGRRLFEVARRHGFVGRVGIASERFTAWAATQAQPFTPLRVVPRVQSAAFLAPLPLALLPLGDVARRTLSILGVKTLGDFAALPPPSVGRRWARSDLDVQEMARGVDPRGLRAFVPDHRIGLFPAA